MNGKGFGVLNVATGISLLPDTRDSHPLFLLAIGLFVSGVVIFVATIVIGHNRRKSEANS